MKIGDLASATGMSAKTIRFYEQEGLLPEPPRTESGYRNYSGEDVERLQFVRQAKLLGLSLQEIRGTLVLSDSDEPTCMHVRAVLDEKIDALDHALKDLRSLRSELVTLRDEAGTTVDCHPEGGNICGIIEFGHVHTHGDALAWIEGAAKATGRKGAAGRSGGNQTTARKRSGRGGVVVQATERITGLGVEELAEAFRGLDIPPKFQPHESRLLIALWRRLAEGIAIGDQEIEEIAGGLGIAPGVAHNFLEWMSERDEEGNIRGVLGLTLNEMFPTKLTHNGEELRTFCAWDSLFLPIMLGGISEVEAPSAMTGEPVRVTVTPEGVTNVSPSGAYISFVVPEVEQRGGIETVEDVWMVFCHHLLYFASKEEATDWAEQRDGQPVALLAASEAFRLAKIAFAEIAQYA